MLPLVNTVNTYTSPPALGATNVPDTNVSRAPAISISPSFSSPNTNADTSGNVAVLLSADSSTPPATFPIADAAGANFHTLIAAASGNSAQPSFMAQLIGQEAPADVQLTVKNMLASYEKLNSDATKLPEPQPESASGPAAAFGSLLQTLQISSAPVTGSTPMVAQEAEANGNVIRPISTTAEEDPLPVTTEDADDEPENENSLLSLKGGISASSAFNAYISAKGRGARSFITAKNLA